MDMPMRPPPQPMYRGHAMSPGYPASMNGLHGPGPGPGPSPAYHNAYGGYEDMSPPNPNPFPSPPLHPHHQQPPPPPPPLHPQQHPQQRPSARPTRRRTSSQARSPTSEQPPPPPPLHPHAHPQQQPPPPTSARPQHHRHHSQPPPQPHYAQPQQQPHYPPGYGPPQPPSAQPHRPESSSRRHPPPSRSQPPPASAPAGHASRPSSRAAAEADLDGEGLGKARRGEDDDDHNDGDDDDNAEDEEEEEPSSRWFVAGLDYSCYAVAQEACHETRKRLLALDLAYEERRFLSPANMPRHFAAMIGTCKQIIQDKEKQSRRFGTRAPQSKSGDFGLQFTRNATNLAGLADVLVPLDVAVFGHMYSVLVLLFRAVVTVRDREEALLARLQVIATKLPGRAFFANAVPTESMKLGAGALFAQILHHLTDLLLFYRSGRLGRLVDALVAPPSAVRFDQGVDRIEKVSLRLRDYTLEAHTVAQQQDDESWRKSVKGQPIVHALRHIERSSLAVSSTLACLERRLARVEQDSARVAAFHQHQYAQSLRAALLTNPLDLYWTQEPLKRIVAKGFHLAPQESWLQNGILVSLTDWMRESPHGPLFWVGGHASGPDVWVTQLTADMALAFQSQNTQPVLHVFCGDLAAMGVPPTPSRLVRGLVVQLLLARPALVYERPEVFTLARFQQATTFRLLWPIFVAMVEAVEEVFFVLDRVEECVPEEQCEFATGLLPELVDLLARVHPAKCIVTSVYEPPEVAMQYEEEGLMESVYIDARY